MKKLRHIAVAGALASAAFVTLPANAAVLDLDYTVTLKPSGVYHYDFTMRLANQDGTWAPGQWWTLFVFGQHVFSPGASTSFTNLTSSDGSFHFSGNAFLYNMFSGWSPTAVGDSISWSGDSTDYLTAGNLAFSSLLSSGWPPHDQVANLISGPATPGVPEPAAWATLIGGFALAGGALRRRRYNIKVSLA